MEYLLLQIFTLVFLFIATYFVSRKTTKEIFYFFRSFIKNEKIVFSLVSLVFLPGTIIHELSHFFMAIILVLPVKDMTIFPKFEKNTIRLGSVLYSRRDAIRGFIVGIAPSILGIMFFWVISHFSLTPFLIYIIFTVSSMMFSSSQDLKDLAIAIPFIAILFIIIGGIIYIFNLPVESLFFNRNLLIKSGSFLRTVNYYFVISFIIHIILIFLLKSLKFIFKK